MISNLTGAPMEKLTVKFPNNTSTDFISDLKSRVEEYFEERKISKKANGWMVAKTLAMFILLFGPYALIMSNLFDPWVMLLLAILMGAGMAGSGFCIAHDALHGAYTSNKFWSGFLGSTFEVMGASSYMWKITHNVVHHTYTNIQGIDEDLDVSPLLRLAPSSEYKWFHRYQHLYVLFAYSLTTLFWVFLKDYQYLARKDLGPYRDIKHPRGEVARLIIMKLIYYTYIIVLPLIFLDITWWQFLIGFLAMHVTAGLILSLVFQLAHVIEGPEHFAAEQSEVMEDAWLVHEMKTTANFANGNRLLCWYVAGLNFQIEHHLFPRVCSIHYPDIAPIVKEVAEEHGIPYNEHPTFFGAVRSHFRTLKSFGHPVLLTQH